MMRRGYSIPFFMAVVVLLSLGVVAVPLGIDWYYGGVPSSDDTYIKMLSAVFAVLLLTAAVIMVIVALKICDVIHSKDVATVLQIFRLRQQVMKGKNEIYVEDARAGTVEVGGDRRTVIEKVRAEFQGGETLAMTFNASAMMARQCGALEDYANSEWRLTLFTRGKHHQIGPVVINGKDVTIDSPVTKFEMIDIFRIHHAPVISADHPFVGGEWLDPKHEAYMMTAHLLISDIVTEEAIALASL